jgi:hypothetical protein
MGRERPNSLFSISSRTVIGRTPRWRGCAARIQYNWGQVLNRELSLLGSAIEPSHIIKRIDSIEVICALYCLPMPKRLPCR